MDHENTPKRMLGRLMHVGQLLANVQAREEDAKDTRNARKTSTTTKIRPGVNEGHEQTRPREEH